VQKNSRLFVRLCYLPLKYPVGNGSPGGPTGPAAQAQRHKGLGWRRGTAAFSLSRDLCPYVVYSTRSLAATEIARVVPHILSKPHTPCATFLSLTVSSFSEFDAHGSKGLRNVRIVSNNAQCGPWGRSRSVKVADFRTDGKPYALPVS